MIVVWARPLGYCLLLASRTIQCTRVYTTSMSSQSDEEFEDDLPALSDFDDDASEADLPLDQEDNETEANDYADDLDDEDEDDEESQVQVRPLRGTRPVRENARRQLSFYEEDDLPKSEDDKPQRKKVVTKLKIPRQAARAAAAAAKKQDEDFSDSTEYRPLRLTERQRAKLEEEPSADKYEDLVFARMDEQLLALNSKTAKKKETAEQMALRKAENARKRATYKTRQLEEEKRETLNKLLKRRATKSRETISEEALEAGPLLKRRRPVLEHPALSRWICRPESSVYAFAE